MTGIRDIAEATGFSVATVSRALRKSPKVTAATSKIIHEAAAKLGYAQNLHVGQLMSSIRRRRSECFRGNLALIWPSSNPGWQNDLPLRRMRESVFQRAIELGFNLDEFDFSSYRPPKLRRILINRGVQGVILAVPSSVTSRYVLEMDLSGFACVALGSGLWSPRVEELFFNTYSGMRLALEKATETFGERVAALWDFDADAGTKFTARASFLAHHPAGAARAEQLFWPLKNLDRKRLERYSHQGRVECLILFPRWNPPDWLLKTLPARRMIWFNYPPTKNCFGWIDLGNELLGRWVVEHVAAKISINETGPPEFSRSVLVPPRWGTPREAARILKGTKAG